MRIDSESERKAGIVGEKYGHLTVLEEVSEKVNGLKRFFCICECDCENHTVVKRRKDTLKYDASQSCGCIRIEDIAGMKFGKLTAIKVDTMSKHKRTHWFCKCDCGNPKLKSVSMSDLKNGNTQSCGCLRRDDLIGRRFGRLVVNEFAGIEYFKNSKGASKWLCECDCGNTTTVSGNALKSGRQVSCGCYNKEIHTKHNKSYDRLYNIYRNMIHRCYNPIDKRYYTHGARGITVCDEWQLDKNHTGMKNFYKWAFNNGYQEDLTIDRIDNNGNYEPLNCRWADYFVQGNNKRNNHMITYNEKTQSLAQWSRECGIGSGTISNRIKSNWSIEKALNTPVKKNKKGCNNE